eukprot:2595884-Rhodomonas_salina.2
MLLLVLTLCSPRYWHPVFCGTEIQYSMVLRQYSTVLSDGTMSGSGNKNSLFYVLLRDCDADTAADRMTRLA